MIAISLSAESAIVSGFCKYTRDDMEKLMLKNGVLIKCQWLSTSSSQQSPCHEMILEIDNTRDPQNRTCHN